MIPNVAKRLGAIKREGDEPGTSRFQVLELARGGHSHLEQKQAKHALEQRDKEIVVVAGDRLSLHAADQPDDDTAKEQVQPRVQENLVQQLAIDQPGLLRALLAVRAIAVVNVAVFHLFERQLELFFDRPARVWSWGDVPARRRATTSGLALGS